MRFFASLSAAVLLCGCGYVGEPLPPALNIPVKITDLKAVEHAGRIVIEFTVPDKTTENLPIKARGKVELFVNSRQILVPPEKTGAVKVETDARPFVGEEVTVRVRTLNTRGRGSDWSNEVKFKAVEPLPPPKNFVAENVEGGVKLRWEAPRASSFRVFRGKDAVATPDKPEWMDTQTEYGKTYEYSVQAFLETAESDIAGPASITPEDRFPPKPPVGLQVIAGSGSVELVWDRNTEADLKGYRIYRAIEGGAFQPLGDPVETPSFSDKGVQSGKKHRYAVSAVDQKGNESGKSEAVEITAP
jgi:bifunctional DNA-binding transcriptional regulator/antitoxin component of YhaV-PrlF toxin-antitoxin module